MSLLQEAARHRRVLYSIGVRHHQANLLRETPALARARVERKTRGRLGGFRETRLMDVAEATRESTNWMAARHKRLLELAVVPVERASVAPLAIERALSVVTEDFEARQYYVTGKLTKSIYAPRCVFDSPDPDTPVRSPQVFASALKGLLRQRPLDGWVPRGFWTVVADWCLASARSRVVCWKAT